MITIRDIRVILTAPMGRNLLIARVDTSEPELYGLGCGTFTQRYLPVATTIRDDLRPLLLGRDTSPILDLHRLMHVNGYWRGGPVLNNAISAIDMALWDIKAKRAQMPLNDLLGGRVRNAAHVYQHADGRDLQELTDHTRQLLDLGLRHIRIRLGGGSASTRASGEAGGAAYGGQVRHALNQPDNAPDGAYYDPGQYTSSTLQAFEHIRKTFGDELDLLHDVHGRLAPAQAIRFAKDLEPFRLFFLEDPLPPEEAGWHERLAQATTTPIATGELFNHPAQWEQLISQRWIHFIRMHLSQIGGLTPAIKLTHTAETFGVRTAWHGPGDLSPIGHAVHLHLNLASPNFGVQELQPFTPETRDVFPGAPEFRNGYLYPNDQPGHGVQLNEDLAAKYPCSSKTIEWTQARLPDGTLTWP